MVGCMAVISEKLAEADEATLREILREAEAYLGAQLTSALAANQRAISFVNFLAAASAVIGSGSTGLLLASSPKLALGLIGAMVAFGLLTAMSFSIWAASPTFFWYVGNTPAQWVQDVEAKKPLTLSLAEQCEFYANNIAKNDSCMEICDNRLKVSLGIAWCSLTFGGALAGSWLAYVLIKTGTIAAKWQMLVG